MGLIVPALAVVYRAGQIEPLRIPSCSTLQQRLRHAKVALIDGLPHLTVQRGIRTGVGALLIAAVLLTVVCAAIALAEDNCDLWDSGARICVEPRRSQERASGKVP